MLARPTTLALVMLLAGCGGPEPRVAEPRVAEPRGTGAAPAQGTKGSNSKSGTLGATEQGTASYYADSLSGRPTASGEPYDPGALTAAHRTLPFGTLVEVTREDGTSVTVRINDRGPFGKKKRIIDLSRRAAETLGIIRAGVAKVTLRVVGTAAKK